MIQCSCLLVLNRSTQQFYSVTLALIVVISLEAMLTDTHVGEVDVDTLLVGATGPAATAQDPLGAVGTSPASPTHTPQKCITPQRPLPTATGLHAVVSPSPKSSTT